MFGLDFALIAGLDMLGRLISIPSNSLTLIEKIRLNIVAAATALWFRVKKLSDVFLIESRSITLTVKLEREQAPAQSMSHHLKDQSELPFQSSESPQSVPA
jgi:hypothetical protein